MIEYYLNLSDEEIEKKIEKLSDNQRRVLIRILIHEENRRKALFVASSYPKNEDKCPT